MACIILSVACIMCHFNFTIIQCDTFMPRDLVFDVEYNSTDSSYCHECFGCFLKRLDDQKLL